MGSRREKKAEAAIKGDLSEGVALHALWFMPARIGEVGMNHVDWL